MNLGRRENSVWYSIIQCNYESCFVCKTRQKCSQGTINYATLRLQQLLSALSFKAMIIFLALVTAVWKEELSGVNCDNMENARCHGTSTSSNDYSFSFISFPSATFRLDKTSDFFFNSWHYQLTARSLMEIEQR